MSTSSTTFPSAQTAGVTCDNWKTGFVTRSRASVRPGTFIIAIIAEAENNTGVYIQTLFIIRFCDALNLSRAKIHKIWYFTSAQKWIFSYCVLCYCRGTRKAHIIPKDTFASDFSRQRRASNSSFSVSLLSLAAPSHAVGELKSTWGRLSSARQYEFIYIKFYVHTYFFRKGER